MIDISKHMTDERFEEYLIQSLGIKQLPTDAEELLKEAIYYESIVNTLYPGDPAFTRFNRLQKLCEAAAAFIERKNYTKEKQNA